MDAYTEEERLAILQESDRHRTWRSLDEARLCVRCTKVFSGHDVKIDGADGDGHHALHCPTDGCDSIPIHWFYHGSGDGRRRSSVEVDFTII